MSSVPMPTGLSSSGATRSSAGGSTGGNANHFATPGPLLATGRLRRRPRFPAPRPPPDARRPARLVRVLFPPGPDRPAAAVDRPHQRGRALPAAPLAHALLRPGGQRGGLPAGHGLRHGRFRGRLLAGPLPRRRAGHGRRLVPDRPLVLPHPQPGHRHAGDGAAAALLLRVPAVAAERAARGRGPAECPAGPHPAPFPVQQHEHDRVAHPHRIPRPPSRPWRTWPTCSAPRCGTDASSSRCRRSWRSPGSTSAWNSTGWASGCKVDWQLGALRRRRGNSRA